MPAGSGHLEFPSERPIVFSPRFSHRSSLGILNRSCLISLVDGLEIAFFSDYRTLRALHSTSCNPCSARRPSEPAWWIGQAESDYPLEASYRVHSACVEVEAQVGITWTLPTLLQGITANPISYRGPNRQNRYLDTDLRPFVGTGSKGTRQGSATSSHSCGVVGVSAGA